MPDIDQTLLTQQKHEEELHRAQLAAQNEAVINLEPIVSIADIGAKKERAEAVEEKPEEMEVALRAEQMEAQNQATRAAEESKVQKAKAAMGQIQQIQKMAKSAQGTARVVNFGSSATIIGLIITFFLMNAQLIFGNFLGVKWVPKLEIWEIMIIGIVDLLLFLIILLIAGIIGAIGKCGNSLSEGLECIMKAVAG
jgi:hypothetical protein